MIVKPLFIVKNITSRTRIISPIRTVRMIIIIKAHTPSEIMEVFALLFESFFRIACITKLKKIVLANAMRNTRM